MCNKTNRQTHRPYALVRIYENNTSSKTSFDLCQHNVLRQVKRHTARPAQATNSAKFWA